MMRPVKSVQLHIARFLVKYRVAFFILMTLLTVGSALLIPHVNINTNMARYLPDNSPMKQGMDMIQTELPDLLEQADEFGGVFADGNDLMPTGLPQTLALGVTLLFVVLLVMSASVMEVLLFLVTIGFAVILNMGSNALLNSVSMLTNTLSSVLQMVLSMDYSIILMNRYRQERLQGRGPVPAMEQAVGGAASSILSSAFTTIVSLLMLCFIKLKIGADLGVVLAKGVTLSLLCNFTVLPTLIVWADKAIQATRKKIPRFPAVSQARFQHRFRIPIAVLFVLVFSAFAFLQRRTPVTFSPQWESPAGESHIQGNALMLLYANPDEDAVPALLDSLAADPQVKQALSYPSLVRQPRTVRELKALAEALSGDAPLPEMPEEWLSLVYYAQTHPRRTETFTLQELLSQAEELSASGLLPEGTDPSALAAGLMPPAPAKRAEPEPAPAPVIPEDTVPVIPEDTVSVIPKDTVSVIPGLDREPPDTTAVPSGPFSWLSYQLARTPLDADQIARYTGAGPSQIAMIFRMAGKQRGKMTLPEFTAYVRDHILGNRRYAAFVPKGMDGQLKALDAALDSVLTAGPDTLAAPEPLRADPEVQERPAESETHLMEEPEAEPAAYEPEPEAEPSPQEVLLEMYLSSRRYPVRQVYKALSDAGVRVSLEEVELLYLYAGARRDADPETALAPGLLLDYVADTLLSRPLIARAVPDSVRVLVGSLREQLLSGVGMLRGPDVSAAVIVSDYEVESPATFAFVERVRTAADRALQRPHYLIGESQMYKELKDAFPGELLLLTLLTVLSIFLIVALTFRSVFIPIPLVMTVMAGVYANVWASGLGGKTLYYLSYLIIQGILMGATIDYSILFTTCYREARSRLDVRAALEEAYRGASHSIMTSGLILVIVPYVMSVSMKDPMISGILSSLAIGALAVLLIILFLLPGVLAALDRVLVSGISRQRSFRQADSRHGQSPG